MTPREGARSGPGGGASRRRLLKRLGLGLGAGASLLAGCGQRPGPSETGTPTGPGTGTPSGTTAEPEDVRERYGTVVDLVEAGADPEGGEPINDLLSEHAGDDTLLVLPEGEYLMDGLWEFREFEHFGVLGEGATIRPPDGYSGYLFAIGLSDRALDLLFRGITFDITAPDTGIRPLQASVQDGMLVDDVAVRGLQDTDQDSFRFDVTDPDGTGEVRNLRMPDGGVPQYLITACYVGDVSRGTLTFRDCHIAGYPDNGIYASQANGPVHVIGGRFENNNISNVRVTSGAVVRGVTVRSNVALEGFNNVRGIRLRSGRDILVEDCDVEFTEVTRSDGAIVMHDDLQNATIRNTRVKVDTDGVPAILAKSPAHPHPEDAHGLRFQNVDVSGSAADESTIQIVGRADARFSNVCINQSGARRIGVRLIGSQDNLIRDSSIHVSGDPLVLLDSTIERENLRTGRPVDGAGGCADLQVGPDEG